MHAFKYFIQKHLRSIHFILLGIVFLIVYVNIFDQKVHLSGDNANYYILGQSLSSGEGYTNIHHLEKEAHFHYPPGYSMLIGIVLKLTTFDITGIKVLNGMLFFLSLIFAYLIIYELSKQKNTAFVTCLLLLFNYHLLTYSTIMMSEIPYLCLSTLCIWLFFKLDTNSLTFKSLHFWILLCLTSISIYLRSIGVALMGSFVLIFLLKKQISFALVFLTGCIALYLPWIIRGLDFEGNTYIQQVLLKNPYKPELGQIGFSEIFERIGINIERYITTEIPSALVIPKALMNYESNYTISEWTLGIFILSMIAIGMVCQKKRLNSIVFYLLLFLSILMLWPQFWYGTRFMIPIIPFLVYFFISGINVLLNFIFKHISVFNKPTLKPALLVITLGVWGVFYAKPSVNNLSFNANAQYSDNYKNYFEIAQWINENAQHESVTAVRKEGLFYLYSNNYVIQFKKTPDLEEQIEFLKAKKVKYVVVDQLGYSSTYNYLYPTIERYPNKFKIILELQHPNTYLMEFKPELGYWGDWENGKRKGFGTYTWEDGQSYEGYWENDVRHGKGKVTFANGESFSGKWTNGILNDTVIKRTINGQIIERSLYQNNIKIKVLETTD